MTTSRLIGRNVREALGNLDLPQLWLAAEIEMNPSSLSKRIRGVLPFNVEELTLIAKALDVSYEQLVALNAVCEDEKV